MVVILLSNNVIFVKPFTRKHHVKVLIENVFLVVLPTITVVESEAELGGSFRFLFSVRHEFPFDFLYDRIDVFFLAALDI